MEGKTAAALLGAVEGNRSDAGKDRLQFVEAVFCCARGERF